MKQSGADLPTAVGFEGPRACPPSTGLSHEWRSVPALILAAIARELVPGQGQFDETLPVGAFGRRGALHRRLGFMLWVVLGTHAANCNRSI